MTPSLRKATLRESPVMVPALNAKFWFAGLFTWKSPLLAFKPGREFL
jgi:hypothetical protein